MIRNPLENKFYDINDDIPAAPAGGVRVKFQTDKQSPLKKISGYVAFKKDNLSSSCNGSNTSFPLSETPVFIFGLIWNATFQATNFSFVGTTLTTAFTDESGSAVAPQTGDTLYAIYAY